MSTQEKRVFATVSYWSAAATSCCGLMVVTCLLVAERTAFRGDLLRFSSALWILICLPSFPCLIVSILRDENQRLKTRAAVWNAGFFVGLVVVLGVLQF